MESKSMLANGSSPRWTPFAAQMGASAWKPGAVARMGDAAMTSEQRQMMGIAVLSALSIAGLHSAICPSYFTQRTFASQPEARQYAMEGLWISLGVSTVASGALYWVFKKWLPAIVAEASALALFGIGVWAVNSKPAQTIPPIEKQNQVTQSTPAAVMQTA
jgi:hypothetical protein